MYALEIKQMIGFAVLWICVKRNDVTDPARREKAVSFIQDAIREGDLRPIIDRVFPFDEVAEAHRYMEAGRQFGNIVVTV